MDLCNAPKSGSSELFSKEALEKGVEPFSHVLHDKAIRRAVTMEKPPRKAPKYLPFSQAARQPHRRNVSVPSPPNRPQGRVLHHLPHLVRRLLISVEDAGVGRSFEGFLPPSQLQVRGILGQHWNSLSSCGAEDWLVEVFCSRYLILFHHLLPVSRDQRHFSSYGSGSAKVQALQEVDKMLETGTLELEDHPDLRCSRLFLVQKAMRGWCPVIDLLRLIWYVTLTKFSMETVLSVQGSSSWLTSKMPTPRFPVTQIHNFIFRSLLRENAIPAYSVWHTTPAQQSFHLIPTHFACPIGLACFTCLLNSACLTCPPGLACFACLCSQVCSTLTGPACFTYSFGHWGLPRYSHTLTWPRTLASASLSNSCWFSASWARTPDDGTSNCFHCPLINDSSSCCGHLLKDRGSCVKSSHQSPVRGKQNRLELEHWGTLYHQLIPSSISDNCFITEWVCLYPKIKN